MGRNFPIDDDDIAKLVKLLGEVAGLVTSLPDRRRTLIERLAELVGADLWMWVHSRGIAEGKPTVVSFLDGGWRDDAERTAVWHVNARADVTQAIATGFLPDLHRPQTFVFDRDHPGWGDGAVFSDHIAPTGMEHLMFALHPFPGGALSGIGLHRRTGRPAFTPREQALTHLAVGQIDWLHHIDDTIPAHNETLFDLTDRQREILIHLLGGDSHKQIAAKLGLKTYTVSDHIKNLHARLGVRTRGELLAKFIGKKS